jgi:hypothetical protein
MTTRSIRTEHVHVCCDVCGRTLLRGEHAETYLAGGSRREVCELCSPRAVHEGWVREGVVLERGTRGAAGEGRRSVLGRLRRSREGAETSRARPGFGPAADDAWHEAVRPPAVRAPRPAPSEPRHVHAVPTSREQRVATATARFNASEHPRTVAGVARSLGVPLVVARPLVEEGSIVTIVVSWELCWYRYEVDLSDDASAVRLAAQGYELTELQAADRAEPNAVADEYGALAPA